MTARRAGEKPASGPGGARPAPRAEPTTSPGLGDVPSAGDGYDGAMLAELVTVGSGYAVGRLSNLVIGIFDDVRDPRVYRSEFTRILRLIEQLKPSLEPGVPLIVVAVVSERTAMPEPEARAVAARFAEHFDYYVGVHEGTGFRASLVRSVIAGMAIAARQKARYDVAPDVFRGAELIQERSNGTLRADEVVHVVDELRREIVRVR